MSLYFAKPYTAPICSLGAVVSLLFFAGCGGNSVTPTGPQEAQVSSATSSVCVTASNKAQTVSVPSAGGVGVTLALAEYDAGDTGCQNATLETGADVSVTTNSSLVRTDAATRANATITASNTAPAPIMSISLGEAAPQTSSSLLGYTTVVSGVTIATGNNVFPDGTYLATCTYFILGEKVENSIVFTAKNGTLTITNGEVPFTANSNVQILIYNRGVVPPGYSSDIPTAAPSAGPSASASPVPSAAPTTAPGQPPSAGPPPPSSGTVGTFSYQYSGTCPPSYVLSCNDTGTLTAESTANGYAFVASGGNVPNFFMGSVTYNFNLSPFTPRQWTVNCPASWNVTVTATTITANIPAPPSPPGYQTATCSITFSNLPTPTTNETYYTDTTSIL